MQAPPRIEPAQARACRLPCCLQAASPLRRDPHRVAAAVEVMERAARQMRLAPQGWPRAMWAVLSSLAL